MNKLCLSLLLLCFVPMMGQTDTTLVAVDSVSVDTTAVEVLPANRIQFADNISSFYEKLAQLEASKNTKVNIVHIGDSHIQADLMTDKVRKVLQSHFGNAGRGFVFPHRLAGTNGSSDYKFTSNANWNGYRNINTPNGNPVGLSGNALTTKARDFVIEFDAKTDINAFNTVKVVTPDNKNLFDIAVAKRTIVLESTVPKKITHRIKNGEVLGSIAEKYNVSISAIKKANGLKNDRIRAGKTLKIPTNQMEAKKVERSEFIPLVMEAAPDFHFYHSDPALDKIYLLPATGASDFALSGLVLENDLPGLIYHSIGVNGAKFSDYSKYPAFFEELKALQPDLVVLSLGTNESFDKMSAADYMIQLQSFLQSVKSQLPQAVFLISTPPPSLFRRRYANTFAEDYAKKIIEMAATSGYAVWDLYDLFGGSKGVMRNAARGIIGGDRVHYTHKGYDKQGTLLSEAILNGYNDYKTNKP
ncbi:GDSL-type esterase/lipase family protein [Flavobacterium silvaticum]|uniref:LysM peptidoglycan-binding domain-containing protein n=1 Tax=Flavobacterium silvaticum TaxID=1852020 RepID=A0A972FU88_9FLAO|nr:GDSL-type esterase/lipase family protein [Flavobacterium silvaticum]NMH29419.1 LysM peptidoglycan-binding domain-containing protein [Flavobacterium silvaticum]